MEGIWGAGPEQVVRERAAYWGRLWNRDSDHHDVHKKLQQMRANFGPPENGTGRSDLAKQFQRTPTKKKFGMDNVDPHFLRRATADARYEIANQIHDDNDLGIIPPQVMLVLTALTFKAAGGDRPITILSMLYRSFCKHDAPNLREWEAEYAGPWDEAKRGRGAADAAWCSEAHFEIARHVGKQAGAVLTDLAKFYDNIGWHQLATDAEKLNFPLRQLVCAIEVYMAPRFVTKHQVLSKCFKVGNSIVAGCGRAVSLIRAFMHDVCSQVHNTTGPVYFREFIDDLFLGAVGTSSEVVGSVRKSLRILLAGLTAKQCVVSHKTTILGSSKKIRSKIHAAALAMGHSFAMGTTTRDLGVDAALSRRRSLKIVKKQRQVGSGKSYQSGPALQGGKTSREAPKIRLLGPGSLGTRDQGSSTIGAPA